MQYKLSLNGSQHGWITYERQRRDLLGTAFKHQSDKIDAFMYGVLTSMYDVPEGATVHMWMDGDVLMAEVTNG